MRRNEIKANPLGLYETERPVPKVPRIFEIINSGASTAEIVNQMSADIGPKTSDMEKVYLGLEELFYRPDGDKSLLLLSKRDDIIGRASKALLGDSEMGTGDFEHLLGINRYGPVVDDGIVMLDGGTFEEVYTHGIKNGYIDPKLSIEECHKKLVNFNNKRPSGNPHLTGSIEDQLLVYSSTFGISEPSYIELNGPREILRLRTLKDPSFLLLGSLGTYSGRQFENYSAKISPKIKTFVIDIKHRMTMRLKKDAPKKDVVTADATLLPFANESMDHIYTNYLFHFFDYGTKKDSQASVEKLMAEAARVLKPGGSLVMVEYPYGKNRGTGSNEALALSIENAAGGHLGFEAELSSSLCFEFTKEASSSIIDANGFGHYEDKMIGLTNDNLSLRYIKE